MNQGPNTTDRTYEYNLATYGPNHVYDDFIQNFTANAFNPKDWLDLFADVGATLCKLANITTVMQSLTFRPMLR
jgi:alpha-L-fucosidase